MSLGLLERQESSYGVSPEAFSIKKPSETGSITPEAMFVQKRKQAGIIGRMVRYGQLEASDINLDDSNQENFSLNMDAVRERLVAWRGSRGRALTLEQIDQRIQDITGFTFGKKSKFLQAALRGHAHGPPENPQLPIMPPLSPDPVSSENSQPIIKPKVGELQIVKDPRERTLFYRIGPPVDEVSHENTSGLPIDYRKLVYLKGTESVYQKETYGETDKSSQDKDMKLVSLGVYHSQRPWAVPAIMEVGRDREARGKQTRIYWKAGRITREIANPQDIKPEDLDTRADGKPRPDPTILVAVTSDKELDEIRKAYDKKYNKKIYGKDSSKKLTNSKLAQRIRKVAAIGLVAASMAIGMTGDTKPAQAKDLTPDLPPNPPTLVSPGESFGVTISRYPIQWPLASDFYASGSSLTVDGLGRGAQASDASGKLITDLAQNVNERQTERVIYDAGSRVSEQASPSTLTSLKNMNKASR